MRSGRLRLRTRQDPLHVRGYLPVVVVLLNCLGQSRNKVAEVIITLLALEKTLDAHNTSVHELEVWLHGGHVDDMVELNLQLIDARLRRTKVTNTIRHHRSALGVEDKAELEKMKKNVYLTARLNARAVKTRIRDRLCQWKFELERLKRSYRASINGAFIYTSPLG